LLKYDRLEKPHLSAISVSDAEVVAMSISEWRNRRSVTKAEGVVA
jgi:hypothetical protein